MILRAFLVALLIAVGEMINGNLRVRYFQRKLGRQKGKYVSFLIGILIIFILAWLCVPWIHPQNLYQCVQVGFIWLLIMTALDLYFGRFVFKFRWKKILDDFNPLKGNLLGIGMLLLLCAPSIIFILT